MSLERNEARRSCVSMNGVYFLVLLLLEGLQRVSGLFFVEAKFSLGSSRLLAVVPFALSRATSCFAGVILNRWKSKFKSGTWVMIGSSISAAGLAFCFMTTDTFWWSVHWGILFGSGLGIASPSLAQEPRKQQTVKSALELSGSSFGCVLLPFAVTSLISHYGLNGCCVVFAGLALNCIPLSLAATYGIRLRLPKRRLRKKTYRMSVENNFSKNNSILSKESFICSLEPDRLQKVSENSERCNEKSCEYIFKPIVEAKNNMAAEDLIKNTPGFGSRMSELATEIKNYEINRTGFEDSFSHSDAMSESPVESSLKNEHSFTKMTHKPTFTSESSCAEVSDSETNTKTDPPMPTDVVDKGLKKNTPVKSLRLNIPIEIKVHVVECTVTTSEETPPMSLPPRTNGYRRHSNSLMSGCYDNIDFTKMFHHKNSKPSPLHKLECLLTSKLFLISEDDPRPSVVGPPEDRTSVLSRLSRPSCLVLVYTSVVFEFTLALMLTIAADFARDNGGTFWSSNWVLVGFGVGGVAGRFWGSRLLVDGSHAAVAVMLLLNGLAVAGALWSTRVGWLAAFFGMFGFVESGVLLALPRLVSDHIDGRAAEALAMTCRGFSGVAMLGLPCAIGFSRDEVGEYEGLLQVTSCLSVLCAVLCYFLPRFTKRTV